MKFWFICGNLQKFDGGVMFGNVLCVVWEKWVVLDKFNCIELVCCVLLVSLLVGKMVLFEIGIGVFFEFWLCDCYGVQEFSYVLIELLCEVGFEYEDVDVVVFSYLYFDYVGGLLVLWSEGCVLELLFFNVMFLVGVGYWECVLYFYLCDCVSFILELLGLLQVSGCLEIVDGFYLQVFGESVCFIFSDGYMLGLMLVEIVGFEQVDGQVWGGVVFCVDLIFGCFWVYVLIMMGYDCNVELLIDEKCSFLEDKLVCNVYLFFIYDLQCVLVQVMCDEKGCFGIVYEQGEFKVCVLV